MDRSQIPGESKTRLWAARIVTAIAVLFLIFDGVTKVMNVDAVVQVRIEHPLFGHTLFPVYVAVLLWGGFYLRDGRVRALIPLRSNP